MFKRNRTFFKRYSKYIDVNIIYQAIFGLASILCAILACVFNYSLAAVFDVMKDVFSTLMVFVVFVVAIHHFKERFGPKKDKFDYIDHWENNKADIYGEDISSFLKPLIYGLQAATYSSEETEELYKHIDGLLAEKPRMDSTTKRVLIMAKAILELFIKTKRLNEPLIDKKVFEDIVNVLSSPCENDIDDAEFAAWCRIFRTDKLELAYECYASGLEGIQKVQYLTLALEKCKECIGLLDSQVRKNPDDRNFALLYLSYLNRNIAQIHSELYKINNDKSDLDISNKYILITYNIRKELYDYFHNVRKAKTLTADYITQEYVLSLSEKYGLEKNPEIKQEIAKEIHSNYDKWVLQSETRNMLLKKITEALEQVDHKKE